ncbi:hypothetical protein MATL_G00236780 [Megalops atlanticus]|uniref:Ig-like domain-containing protein n=1 Tax=Megalops atlanticus TaxID=7932 RepID=A0A9D3PFY2_MEGAT|nr:hypothetical protein MATL_G00236780 [Megalops atlanticus]
MRVCSCDSLQCLLWSVLLVQTSDSCSTTITMLRDERYVGLGQNFSLTCEFVCIRPSIRLQWYKDNQSLSSTSSSQPTYTLTLHVVGARQNHSGIYYCQTQPPIATGNNMVIEVVDLALRVSRSLVELLEGEALELNCTAVSPLNATLFWVRGDCADGHNVSSRETLLIFPVSVQDSGNYHCCGSIPTFTPLHRASRVQVTVHDSGFLPHQLLLYLTSKALFAAAVILLVLCRGRCRAVKSSIA